VYVSALQPAFPPALTPSLSFFPPSLFGVLSPSRVHLKLKYVWWVYTATDYSRRGSNFCVRHTYTGPAPCCSVFGCVAVYGSALQCVALC